MKTRLQTTGGDGAGPVASEIYDEEGWPGLFRGGEAIAVGYFINGAFAFGLTEFLKRTIGETLDLGDAAWAATVAGSFGGAVAAVVVVTPFEAAKVRAQTRPGAPIPLLQTFRDLIRERGGWYEGLFGRSLGALVAKDVVFAAFKFAVFDACRDSLLTSFPGARGDGLSAFGVSLAAGAIAGACGALASQPLDTTFARIETAPGDDGVFGTARTIFQEDGRRPRRMFF